jgi:L-ascorbate metabolism protein UlaG (beta-lactamase superfamily)
MDQFTRKQQEIERRAAKVSAAYPTLWSDMIAEWRQPGSDDRAWLMYSANYLFRTANVRWAMDPLRLKHRLPDAPEVPVEDLRGLDFILLTHRHSDHLDLNLLHGLQDFPILWVIPAPVLPLVQAEVEIPANRLIVPEPMRTVEIQGIRITPFDGLHWEQQPGTSSLRGLPSIGYLIEFNGKRWLFPGDTRTYDVSRLPSFGPVDGLFAHVWLGRAGALQDEPPLLEAFCRFFVDLLPKRIILTHLDEFGRDANDYWDSRHVQKVKKYFLRAKSSVLVSFAKLGGQIILL